MNKRTLLPILLLFFSGIFSYAGTVVSVYKFSYPSVSYSGVYSTITFKGTKSLGEAGKATLPFYPVEILLPPGEIAVSVKIEYLDPVKMKGKFILYPRQEARPISTGEGEWQLNTDFYKSNQPYPSSYRPDIATHFYSGFGIAVCSFTPVRYIPSKKQVSYFRQVVVTVETAPDPNASAHLRLFYPSENKIKFLKGIVQNPELVTRYISGRDTRTNEYDYLIITKSQYVPEFDTLITFYKPRGIKIKVTSIEYINSNFTGADSQEKIRNYIINEYTANGIDYVMLGGDKEIVPYRGFYCYVQSGSTGYSDENIPADLYYSALDGNWNTDGDGRWAEPEEDDLYPEVAVGRLTFSDTVELHNMLHKVILYQANPVEGELTSPLLSGEYLYGDPVTYGSDYIDLLVGYRCDNGYCTHGIPTGQPLETLYDTPTHSWSKAEMISQINSGHPWVHHCGHANQTYVMKMSNSDITNANFSGANGITHNYTIVYTHGCICGGFDYSDCIGEKMISIDNMAVSFVGNSRYGWFNQGTTDGPSEHLHREFMDGLYHDSLYHIGMAHLKSKSETAPYVEVTGEFEPGATRWCFYDNNVLGDPMMALWTEEPYLVTADFPDLIPIGAGSVSVHVSSAQGNCHNFTCSLYRNDTLFGSAMTNGSGNAVIETEEYLAEGPIWLVISGYNILPQYFQLHVADVWLGLTNIWSDPDNWYSGNVPDQSSYIIIPSSPVGQNFPDKNESPVRQCKAIRIEPGALFMLGDGESFSIGGD